MTTLLRDVIPIPEQGLPGRRSSAATPSTSDAVVLFLDELILWLASHSAEPAFVSREGQKLAKLVEAEITDRPAPLISFVARQRDSLQLGHLVPVGDLFDVTAESKGAVLDTTLLPPIRQIVQISPNIMSGTPVFKGTR